MRRIIAAGHLNWDVTLRVASLPDPDGEARITEQHRSGGGSAANVASGLVSLDIPTGLIGSVGADSHGKMAKHELRNQGVDVSNVLTVSTGSTTVKYLIVDENGEVMVLANDGVNEAIGPEDVEGSMLSEAEHVHLTSQRPDTAAKLVELAHERGLSVSFDPGRRVETRTFDPLLDQVDVLLLNEPEAEAVLEAADGGAVEDADRVIVIKRGSDGASVYTDSTTVHHPGFAVDAVDTTGAGDAFAAGFLAATVGGFDADGSEPDGEIDYERVLSIANASGALAVKQAGARSAPTAETLAAFLKHRREH